MINTTANFDAENAKTVKSPCIVIAFEEQDAGPTDIKYSSNTFADINQYYKRYIKSFEYQSRTYDLGNPIFTGKEHVKFTLIDNGGEIISLLANNKIRQKEVTIKIGYAALNLADFIELPTYIVTKVEVANNMIDHIFTCELDLTNNEFYVNEIYRDYPETKLTAPNANADVTMTVNSTTGFLSSLPDGHSAMAIQIGSEIKTYTGKTATTFTGCSGAAYNTAPGGTYPIGKEVKQVYVLNESFGQILLRLATTSDAGGNGKYDLNIDGLGAEIDESYFDLEQIERESWKFHAYERDVMWLWEPSSYVINKKRTFIEFAKEALKPFNAVIYMAGNGKYNIKILDYPFFENDTVTEKITEDQGVVTSLNDLESDLITTVDYKRYLNPGIEVFERTDTEKNDDSDSAYSSFPNYEIRNYGMISNAVLIHNHTRDRFFIFYGNIIYEANISTFSSRMLYEPFDSILLNDFNSYPNYDANNRTWNNLNTLIKKKQIILRKGQFSVEYKAFLFKLVNKASTLYTFNTDLDSDVSFDDKTLTYNANWSLTKNAEDAYWDVPFPPGKYDDFHYLYARITITPPGSASPAEQWINIGLMAYSGAVVNLIGKNTTKIRYNSGWSTAFDVWIPCFIGDNANAINYIKLDFHDRSTAITGQLPSSIIFEEVRGIKRDFTVS